MTGTATQNTEASGCQVPAPVQQSVNFKILAKAKECSPSCFGMFYFYYYKKTAFGSYSQHLPSKIITKVTNR
jgi:hypothetical protein